MKKLILPLLLGSLITALVLTSVDFIELRTALAQVIRPTPVTIVGADGVAIGGGVVGSGFYSIERTNISTSSVNLAFGITSKKVKILVSSANTDDICIDYAGSTAVCPAANTAGDDRLKPGTSLFLDDFKTTSISVISVSGTQSIQVTAWQ